MFKASAREESRAAQTAALAAAASQALRQREEAARAAEAKEQELLRAEEILRQQRLAAKRAEEEAERLREEHDQMKRQREERLENIRQRPGLDPCADLTELDEPAWEAFLAAESRMAAAQDLFAYIVACILAWSQDCLQCTYSAAMQICTHGTQEHVCIYCMFG